MFYDIKKYLSIFLLSFLLLFSTAYSQSSGDETTTPGITLLGTNTMNLNVDDTFSDPGVTWQDNEDGYLSASIQSSSNINTTVNTASLTRQQSIITIRIKHG